MRLAEGGSFSRSSSVQVNGMPEKLDSGGNDNKYSRQYESSMFSDCSSI